MNAKLEQSFMDLPKSMAGRSLEHRDLPKIEKVTHGEGPTRETRPRFWGYAGRK
jgi:hypothetical protein